MTIQLALYLKIYVEILNVKDHEAETTSKTQQLILIYTEVNFCLTDSRQLSKSSKIQPLSVKI